MKRNHRRLILIAILFCIAIFVFSVSVLPKTEKGVQVSFLSVGQGDAVFIEAPNGTQVLVDSGADGSVLRELGKVMSFWDRSIDIVAATHPDMDHIGGFPEIFQRFDIEYVLDTETESDTGIYEAYVENRDREKSERVIAEAGQVIVLDKKEGVFMEVLFPGDVSEIKDKNDASIILRLVYGEKEVLLTGDASKKIERYLVSVYGDRLESDILKLGHHGSKTSTDKTFVERVNPETVVVSAGLNNRFGHPHQEVLDIVAGREVLDTRYGTQTLYLLPN
jgi:competence protein ComEC